MSLKVFSAIFFFVYASQEAQSVCSVKGIGNLNWLYSSKVVIPDDHVGVVETFPISNVDRAYIEECPYLEAKVENSNIIISTTLEFSNIEERQNIPITATLVTVCGEIENRMIYVLELKDTNNHEPKFEKENYDMIFYDKIPYSYEMNLNEFDEIAVVDFDFSTEKVMFSIEDNDYLDIESAGISDPGNPLRFIGKLILKHDITAPFQQSFIITAIDDDANALSSTTTLTITVLRSELPNFTRALYEAYVDDNKEIVMIDDYIALENVTSSYDIRFNISTEHEKYFKLNINGNLLNLSLTDEDPSALVSKKNSTILVSIYAVGVEPDIYAETAVLVNMGNLLEKDVSNEDEKEVTADSIEETSVSNVDDTTTIFEDSTPDDKTPNQPQHSYVYTQLRGFEYWLSVNKIYVALFSVLTGFSVLAFFCIAIRKRNVRIE